MCKSSVKKRKWRAEKRAQEDRAAAEAKKRRDEELRRDLEVIAAELAHQPTVEL